MRGMRLAVSLLSILPVPAAGEPDRRTAGAAMVCAPAVGLLLGMFAAAGLLLVGSVLGAGAFAGAAVAVAALALLTRGLHLDGLADLADGLGSGKPADAALAIMRRSDIGPMGVVTLVCTLLIQVAALTQALALGPGRGAAAVIAAVVTGRVAIMWGCRDGVPSARPDGLGALVAGTVRPAVAALVTGLVLAACAGAAVMMRPGGWTLPAGVLGGLIAARLLERHAVRRLGGITGDVLGAVCEVATTVALLVAAVRPGR